MEILSFQVLPDLLIFLVAIFLYVYRLVQLYLKVLFVQTVSDGSHYFVTIRNLNVI